MRERVWIVLAQLALIHHLQCANYTTGLNTQNSPKDYTGYSVFRIVPTNEEDVIHIQSLMDKEELSLDIWKPPTTVNQAVDVMIPPNSTVSVENFLTDKKIPRTILISDVERLIKEEEMRTTKTPSDDENDINTFFNNYRKLFDIHRFIEQLVEQRSPRIASIISIGKSLEGNDLKAIKIGSQSSNGSKPAIWIDGGIHAREWISPATVTFIAYRLVHEYDDHQDVKELVDYFDWYILPVVNPDGYIYSHEFDRMWRKSRRVFDKPCQGVDLNRNFGFHWGGGGAASEKKAPCDNQFAGTQAFSEPETKAISEFILKHKDNFKAYLAIHSYSQLWLTPWGWTYKLPEDYDQMVAVAREGVDALSAVHGTRYKIGSSTNILYVAAGGADDWAYGVAGIKYSYTVELRDMGKYGHVLPSDQIIPTGKETWAGIKAMAKAIKRDVDAK